jgi:predicted CopG family antitoxin
MSANIRVDEALNEKLKKLKEEWKLPSVSAVMEKLLEDREDPASSNGEEEVASDSHSAEQKPEKAGQFLDYETLKREARAVKYFNWVERKMHEVG